MRIPRIFDLFCMAVLAASVGCLGELTPLEGGGLLVKFFDLEPGSTRVNFLNLTETEPGSWKSEHHFAPLIPLSRADLDRGLESAGFEGLETFGSADGRPYEEENSQDLFVKATLRS